MIKLLNFILINSLFFGFSLFANSIDMEWDYDESAEQAPYVQPTKHAAEESGYAIGPDGEKVYLNKKADDSKQAPYVQPTKHAAEESGYAIGPGGEKVYINKK